MPELPYYATTPKDSYIGADTSWVEVSDGVPAFLGIPRAVADFVAGEARFAILSRTQPERAKELLALQQADVDERWRYYEQLAAMSRTVPHGAADVQTAEETP